MEMIYNPAFVVHGATPVALDVQGKDPYEVLMIGSILFINFE